MYVCMLTALHIYTNIQTLPALVDYDMVQAGQVAENYGVQVCLEAVLLVWDSGRIMLLRRCANSMSSRIWLVT